jgi:hypothetical protein
MLRYIFIVRIGCLKLLIFRYTRLIRKLNALKYTDYLEECAKSVVNETHLPSDAALLYYIRLAHHTEDVSDTFGFEGSSPRQNMTEEGIAFSVRTFELKLTEYKADMPPFIASDRQFHF